MVPATCVLELGVELHIEPDGWLTKARMDIATESISLFEQDGDGIWGSRSNAALDPDGAIHHNVSGLEHDLQFASSLDMNSPKVDCNGTYGLFDFTGTPREGSRLTNYAGTGKTYSCVADFPCIQRTKLCQKHPESVGCPESAMLRGTYRHGECAL